MKKGTLNIWIDVGLVALLMVTILAATIEIFIPCFVHVILGLLLSAGALTHIALHWEWVKNAFKRFRHLPALVRTSFLLTWRCFWLTARLERWG